MAQINIRQQYAQYNRYFTQIKETYEKKPFVKESVQLLLSLLTISFLVIFALRPTVNTISELFANVRNAQDVSQKLDAKIQSLSQAKQVWDQQQSNLEVINQSIADKPMPDTFLQQLEGLSAIHNVTINGLSEENVVLEGKDLRTPEQKKDDQTKSNLAGTNSILFSFTVIGSYANCISFLSDIEHIRSQVLIKDYSLSINNSTQKNEIMLKITGTIPYLDSGK